MKRSIQRQQSSQWARGGLHAEPDLRAGGSHIRPTQPHQSFHTDADLLGHRKPVVNVLTPFIFVCFFPGERGRDPVPLSRSRRRRTVTGTQMYSWVLARWDGGLLKQRESSKATWSLATEESAADCEMPFCTFSSASSCWKEVSGGGDLGRGWKTALEEVELMGGHRDSLVCKEGKIGKERLGGNPEVDQTRILMRTPVIQRAVVLFGQDRTAGLGAGGPGAARLLGALRLSFFQVSLYLLHRPRSTLFLLHLFPATLTTNTEARVT